VTGSDGKTTTTTIISELLKAAGYTVHLGGNIGKPLLCELPNMQEKDMAVLELSSFQLHSMTCRPHTAVITNISPNHLDKHKDFQDYIDAKRSIFLNQQAEDRLILFADDEHSAYYASQAPSRVSWFSDTRDARPGCLCREGRILWVSEAGEERYIMNADEIRIPGQHNVRNYLAAFEAVRGLVSPELCRETARAFAGVEHRLEEVRVFRGVRYINDSIASSPTRTIAGLRALKTRPIILLGGYDKHLPFDSLGDEVCKRAKAAIVAGDTAERIIEAIEKSGDNHGFPVYRTENMTESVKLASRIAEAGDTVILSPACASFDQFRNFEERGRCFKRLVMELE
jgi:UDP-N-acetylmuramoylalanine--D-glutamate ligase